MLKMRKFAVTAAIALFAVVGLTGVACQAATETATVEVATEVVATEAVATEVPVKEEIVFVDLNWDSALVQTEIASAIIEHGYEYPVSKVPGDTVKIFPALQSGSAHVAVETWVSNAQEAYDKALSDGYMVRVGDNLQDNWQGWVVPQYVKDENPGLVSVTDIEEYKEVFATVDSGGKARFVTCIPGWGCETINANKFDGYDMLGYLEPFNPGSQEAMFADLKSTYDRGEPWLGYLWNPSQLAVALDLYVLEEPDWSQECWDTDQACAYPVADIGIVAATSLRDRAPEVIEFFDAYDFTSRDLRPIFGWMELNDETPENGAIWYLKNNDNWRSFVPSDVAGRVDAALDDIELAEAPAVEKEEIVFVDLNWDSALVQTEIASAIVEHGYEYPVSKVPGDTVKIFPALQSGSAHVAVETWISNAQEAYDKALADGYMVRVGDNLKDNWQGWVVPQYVKDANPGLVSVSDIEEHKEVFATVGSGGKARFVTCIPGWGCEAINANKFEAYDMLDYLEPFNPGSQEAMFADLKSTYDRGEPWLGYLWNPSQLAVALDLYVLEEPDWSQECWDTTQACAYPIAEIGIVAAASLAERAPEVIQFFNAYDFSSQDLRPVFNWMEENDETPENGAIWYLQNSGKWRDFVPNDVAQRVDDALSG